MPAATKLVLILVACQRLAGVSIIKMMSGCMLLGSDCKEFSTAEWRLEMATRTRTCISNTRRCAKQCTARRSGGTSSSKRECVVTFRKYRKVESPFTSADP